MRIEEIIEQYQPRVPKDMGELFKNFPREEDVILRHLKPGIAMLTEGVIVKNVYILLCGTLKLSWEMPGRDKYVFLQNEALLMLGDIAVMAQLSKYSTTVIAETNCEVICLSVGQFWRWMDHDPMLFRHLVAENLQKLLFQSNIRRNSEERSSYTRMLIYFRWYYLTYRDLNTKNVVIRRTRDQIAEDISLISVRTINRILENIVTDGMINIKKGKINISETQFQMIIDKLKYVDF